MTKDDLIAHLQRGLLDAKANAQHKLNVLREKDRRIAELQGSIERLRTELTSTQLELEQAEDRANKVEHARHNALLQFRNHLQQAFPRHMLSPENMGTREARVLKFAAKAWELSDCFANAVADQPK